MARAKLPRRILLSQLREMKKRIDRVISSWDVASTVYESKREKRMVSRDHLYFNGVGSTDGPLIEREYIIGTTRKREASEYPENSRTEWAYAIHSLDALIREAEIAREAAYQQWKLLPHHTDNP